MQVSEQRAYAELAELSHQMREASDLRAAHRALLDATLRLLTGSHAVVRVFDESRRELVPVAQTGGRQRVVALEAGQGIIGWVAATGRPARVADLSDHERALASELPSRRVKSLLAVPLEAAGDVVGVLALFDTAAAAYDDVDESALGLLGQMLVGYLDRVRFQRVTVPDDIEHALSSPLRVRILAELLEAKDGLTQRELVLRSGRGRGDVSTCVRTMVGWGAVALDGERVRLRDPMPGTLRRQLEAAVEGAQEQIARERHVRHHLMGGIVGIDPKMQMVFDVVRQVGRIDVPVLISGETGTGKELVARAIHDTSERNGAFFGAVNCATLHENLVESQLFGHRRGAFTGAVQDYMGLVERCHRGTLFLDEVGELSPGNQVKLLRLLQEGTFTRLGATEPRHSDFRLISATNRDLAAMVKRGEFREDLFYRLSVFPIRIPPLRERLSDLPYLVDSILAAHAQRFSVEGAAPVVTREALTQLQRYHWPGNVRELENALARAVVMAGGGSIGVEHLPFIELMTDRPPESFAPDDTGEMHALRSLQDMEREHIAEVLMRQGGNVKASALVLGISRTTLYKKMRDYEIEP